MTSYGRRARGGAWGVALLGMVGIGVLGLGTVGCANPKIDKYQQINQTSASRIEQLNQDVKTLQTTVERKQTRIDELEGEVGNLKGIRTSLETKVTDIKSRQASLQKAIGNLRLVSLDPETDRALQALAAQHSNVVRYDSTQGLVTFTSDLTFGSGSDQIKTEAAEGLNKLAEIMLSSTATGYDIRIVGHTDNQRMSNPATLRKFGTNRHLSFYRAAAVEKILREAGIPGERLETVGWGEYRPLVPNNARGGTASNRRVEIYIVPTSAQSGTTAYQADAPVDTPAEEQTPPARRYPSK